LFNASEFNSNFTLRDTIMFIFIIFTYKYEIINDKTNKVESPPATKDIEIFHTKIVEMTFARDETT